MGASAVPGGATAAGGAKNDSHHQRHLPVAARLDTKPGHRVVPDAETRESPAKRGMNETRCSRDGPTSSTGTDSPKTTARRKVLRLTHPTAVGLNSCATTNNPSKVVVKASDLGWNREWCRAVDSWCRNASARVRSRLAGQVIESARRLHWLAGPGRSRTHARCRCRCCVGGGRGGYIDTSFSGNISACSNAARTQDKGSAQASSIPYRSHPREVISAEAWMALAKFGQVTDLLEIVGSTAELVVSVQTNSIGQQQQPAEEVPAYQEEDEAQGMAPISPGEYENSEPRMQVKQSVAHDEGLPARAEGLRYRNADGEDSSTASSLSAGSSHNTRRLESEPAASGLSPTTESLVDTTTKRNLAGRADGMVTDSRDGALSEGEQGEARRADLAFGHGPDTEEVWPTQCPSDIVADGERAEADGVDALATHRRHSAPRRPSLLVAVNEEGDTDMEASSSDEDLEWEGDNNDLEIGGSPSDSRSDSEIGRRSRLDADPFESALPDAERVDSSCPGAQSEAGDETPGSRDDAISATAGNRQEEHSHENDGGANAAACSKTPLAMRITLEPAAVENFLGIPMLSAFVLQASRRTQHTLSASPARFDNCGGAHDSEPRPLHARSSADHPTGRGLESLSSNHGAVETDNGERASEINPSTARPPLPVDATTLPSLQPQSVDGTSSACTLLSETEELGLACALETHVFPHMRICSSSKGRNVRPEPGKTSTIRLRLKLELPKTSSPNGGRVPKPDNAAATARPEVVRAAPSTSPASFPAGPSPPRSATAPGSAMTDGKLACARRYLEAPIHRWVGRVNGRRCLLSSTATPSIRGSLTPPIAGAGDHPTGIIEQHWKDTVGRSHINNAARVGTRGVRVMFMRDQATNDGFNDPTQHQPQQQRFVLVDTVPAAKSPGHASSIFSCFWSSKLSAPVGSALSRPLCHNCGRYALQRLLVNTDLLAQSTFSREAGLLRPDWHTSTPAEINRLGPGGVRPKGSRREGKNTEGAPAARGRLADWVCSSGAMLCNSCLRAMRSAAVPLERLA